MDASSKRVAAQELEGKFPGTIESPSLGVIDYGRAFVGRVALAGNEASPAVLGVDIGETVDFTWLTVLSVKGVVLAQERFNAGTPGVARATFYPDLETRIWRVASRWGVSRVVIDSAKAGKPISQGVERRFADANSSVEVVAYGTDSPGKKAEAIERLAVALGRGDVRVPASWSVAADPETSAAAVVAVDHVDQLRKEFEELVAQDLPYGKRRWTHPEGGHDDGIVALALAFHGLATQPETMSAEQLDSWEPIAMPKRRF
jgi:hypothetical protein